MLFEIFKMIRTVVVTDALGQDLGRELGSGFHHCSFAMHPFWLNRVEPGALARQEARDQLYPHSTFPAVGKHRSIVCSYPTHDLAADMPGRIVPNEHQHPLTFLGHKLANPLQVSRGHMRNRSPLHEAQQHLLGIITQQPIATQRRGVWVLLLSFLGSLVRLKLLQAQRLSHFCPGVHTRLGYPAPPCSTILHPESRPSSLQQLARRLLQSADLYAFFLE